MDDRRDDEIHVERTPRTGEVPAGMQVRDEDLEPHAGLRYIARLFKILAILLILLLIGEIIVGIARQGASAIPMLLVESTRLVVFAGMLWGAGDLALMLIESNHDLRATRILVGRLSSRLQRMEEGSGFVPPPPPGSPPPRSP